MLFPCLTILIIFILWMTFKSKLAEHRHKTNTRLFWEKEQRANEIRKQPLNSIDYITIPLDRLPFHDNPSEQIANAQSAIEKLADKQIANFNHITNTDLKLKYGAANLDVLSKMDQNYTTLVRTLYQWGQALYEEENFEDALTVLEFGVACKTDISKHYTLLAKIYKQKNKPDKIKDLLTIVDSLDFLMKASTIKALNEISESCHAPG